MQMPSPKSRRWGDSLFRGLTFLAALGMIGLVMVIAVQLIRGSQLAFTHFGLGFVTGSRWDPVHGAFGSLPLVYGTIVSSLIALLIAVPLSLGIAIYLAELAPHWVRTPVSFLVELLAAIPSVVYGLWGVFVLVPLVRTALEPFLQRTLGWLPFFQGTYYGFGMLAAGIILAIMIIPTISAVSREVLLAVPNSQREAMLALGATRWETIKMAVLPYGRSGILGAVILGLGRAIGETMAVTMVIGNRPQISPSVFELAQTIASIIANEFSEAFDELHLSALVMAGLVLFVVTLLLNILARLLVWRVARAPEGVTRE
ncbi:phosphate ABC transporter permease subunit PstC [Neomoorella mulderi]|uniref:Phosphate transport system permease protein n=1 Tax=Moorella mulderi DSM 14980 TaxID=1122241 RepID=A0A151AVX5_9FIRM|nr:phosphate ABC transporter permease subunit PstC [Moorella mulderi]KYH31700.1 phosphate transport system permease protein PstC [Moorella mulderi DSM 14980]